MSLPDVNQVRDLVRGGEVRSHAGSVARQRGVTAIELLMVVAITFLLIAIGAPAFNSLRDRTALVEAAETVAASLELMKQTGLRRGENLTLSVDTGHWCIGIHPTLPSATPNCTCATAGSCLIHRVDGRQYDRVPSLAATEVDFDYEYRRGTFAISGLGNGSLTLATAKGLSLKINISTVGRIRVCAPGQDVTGYPAC